MPFLSFSGNNEFISGIKWVTQRWHRGYRTRSSLPKGSGNVPCSPPTNCSHSPLCSIYSAFCARCLCCSAPWNSLATLTNLWVLDYVWFCRSVCVCVIAALCSSVLLPNGCGGVFFKKGKKGGICWQGATSPQQVETGVITYLPAPRWKQTGSLGKATHRGVHRFIFPFPQCEEGSFASQKYIFIVTLPSWKHKIQFQDLNSAQQSQTVAWKWPVIVLHQNLDCRRILGFCIKKILNSGQVLSVLYPWILVCMEITLSQVWKCLMTV